MTSHSRFWSKVNKNGPVPDYAPELGNCWLWTAVKNSNRYGSFWDGVGHVQAHRWAYEEDYGPIPNQLEIDHLCRVRHCVRLAHIELVTHRENMLRGEGAASLNVAKTCCPRGHPYDEANVYLIRSGGRACRQCRRERERERRRRWRAERKGQ